MKTKDLIKRLQELDPSGEVEVVLSDNSGINFIEILPASYDGTLQILTHNERGRAVGGRYQRAGNKIKIHFLSIEDAVSELERNFEVDYSALPEYWQERERKGHEQIIEESKAIYKEINVNCFVEWALSRVPSIPVSEAKKFAEENLDHNDEPVFPIPLKKSYNDVVKEYWDTKYESFLARYKA